MCNKAKAKLCAQCRSCYYCSSPCQKSDWSCHKRLCRAFAEQPPRPSPSHKRAIFFPVNCDQPEMIWILCVRKRSDGIRYEMPSLDPYFGDDQPLVKAVHIDINSVRGRQLGLGLSAWAPTRAGYSISLKHRETFLVDGSSLNRSLLASVGTSGTVPHRWCGPLVAMRETHDDLYEDITAGDFRHLIDYVTSYLSTDTPETGPDPHARTVKSARGVKLSCCGEERLHGAERFVSVDVPWFHPAWNYEGSLSPMSKLLGVPLRLWKYPDFQSRIDPPGWEYHMGAGSNQNAAYLMIEPDLKSSEWGWAPRYWDLELGNVLVVREDGQDLDVNYLTLLCRFVWAVLKPMVEDASGRGTIRRTKKEVRDFITAENLEKFAAAATTEEASRTSSKESS